MFHGCEYVLKSGMLYTGSGDQGHWRCIVQSRDRLIVLNDESVPVNGTLLDLALGTDFIFSKNFTSCIVCNATFARPQFMRRHALSEHDAHRCDECDEFFVTVSLRCQHVKKSAPY